MPCATRRGATRPTTRAHSAALHGRGDRICVRAQAGVQFAAGGVVHRVALGRDDLRAGVLVPDRRVQRMPSGPLQGPEVLDERSARVDALRLRDRSQQHALHSERYLDHVGHGHDCRLWRHLSHHARWPYRRCCLLRLGSHHCGAFHCVSLQLLSPESAGGGGAQSVEEEQSEARCACEGCQLSTNLVEKVQRKTDPMAAPPDESVQGHARVLEDQDNGECGAEQHEEHLGSTDRPA
mmetsp:Transcript_8281/g.19593  ORF Transcript_8281/g.19593 Transcript_8281/m.19593 type:complete len:237 (+) Transcript_8281:1451-2161(+)